MADTETVDYADGGSPANIAEVKDLVVRFGGFTAVDGLSFEVRDGEIFGFLGPNGAGKTTTIRAITTIQRPTSGRIAIDGFDTSAEPLKAKARIGIAQQHIALDKDLTVGQNIYHHALLRKIPKKEIAPRIEEITEMLGLKEYMDRKVSDLSGGWKRKVAIVCSVIHKPKLLLLDEPTAGLDTRSRHVLWDMVRRLNSEGTTIFLTTHYIEEAEALCHRVAVVNRGKLVAVGTVDELKNLVGRIAVETEDCGTRRTKYFASWEEAKKYADSLGDVFRNVRKTTLEDVFLELTGENRGKFV